MPSDYSFIADNPQGNPVNQMNASINLGKGIQGYQSNAIELQKQNQLNQDRIALQQFTSDPNNWQTDGKIDMQKINAAVPQIAPLAGPEYVAKMTTLGGAQTQATEAKTNLTTQQRGIYASAIGALGYAGIKDPNIYSQVIGKIKDQYSDNPDMVKLGSSYQTTLGMSEPGDNVPKTAIQASQALMAPASQQASLAPSAQMLNTGGEIKPVIVQPAAGGNEPSITVPGQQPNETIKNTLPVGQREEVQLDKFGNPIVMPRSAFGKYGAPQALPGSQPAPMVAYPAGESADTKAKFENEYHAATSNYQQSGTIHSYNTDLLRAIDAATTGTAGPLIAKAQSIFGNVPGGTEAEKAASAYDMVGKYTERQALLATQAMGMQTNASLDAQIKANGSQAYNPTALKTITKLNDALQTGMDAYTPGLQKAIQTSPNQIFAKRQFDMQWGANFKPEVMQLYNAAKTGDKAEVSNIIQSVGGKGSQGAQDLLKRAHNIQMLSQQGHL